MDKSVQPWQVQLFELNFDRQEAEAVQEVIESGWITMGEKTRLFEQRFAELLDGKVQAIAVANGTAALHMALLAVGAGPGDEVILPALTFVADLNVVRMVGAKPVLADCRSLSDWNIDPEDIEGKITPRTKAVLIVHYAGYPCDMGRITAICRRHGLALIEDCAHAPGGAYRGQKCGTFGDIGCFSFFTNKNLSVGEGGMFVTASEELGRKGGYLRSHGMTSLTLDRHEGRTVSYDVAMPGLNYRMDEMRAALGLVQLAKLEEANQARRRLAQTYDRLLAEVPGVSIPFRNLAESEPTYHIYPILMGEGIDRRRVIDGMKARGVQTSIHYPPFQEFGAYRDAGLDETPIANTISRRELTLPLFPTMGTAKVEVVVESLKQTMAGLK
jgi:dTDP-4-amino-4,6-dideoxygalactose transaminase